MKKKNNTLIIGAGTAGRQLTLNLKKHHDYKIVGFLDDDNKKQGIKYDKIPVLGKTPDLSVFIKRYAINLVCIAIPSLENKTLIQDLVKICQKLSVKTKIIPSSIDIIQGRVDISLLRDIEVQDVLGRTVVKTDFKKNAKNIDKKTVLITGASGSIGSEIVLQTVLLGAKKVICVDISENGIFNLRRSLAKYTNIEYYIADVRDTNRIEYILKQHEIDIVYHAAAYKHVFLLEHQPYEAIKNNIIASRKLMESVIKYQIPRLVIISTDKAVNPAGVMGASKRAVEKVMECYASSQKKTVFCAVRFGNVLGSSGSVMEIFKDQIKKGGPVTVTDPNVIRYFMTTQEAVSLVIQAGSLGKSGEIFILDMGEPVKISELAKNMIELMGLRPYKDIDIKFTGLKKGEKLYEELLLNQKALKTNYQKIFIAKEEEKFNYEDFMELIDKIEKQIEKSFLSSGEAVDYLKKLVPQYKK